MKVCSYYRCCFSSVELFLLFLRSNGVFQRCFKTDFGNCGNIFFVHAEYHLQCHTDSVRSTEGVKYVVLMLVLMRQCHISLSSESDATDVIQSVTLSVDVSNPC